MKCKYCNAEVAPNARFCTACGGDLSKFDKCVSCGEFIDKGESTCPHCGAEQPQIVQPQNGGSKTWLWIVGAIILLGIMGGGGYYLISNKTQTDSIVTTGEDLNAIETRLHEILSKLVTNEGEHYLPEFFTEGFNTYYKRACEKADKEMYECPKIWWQISEDDPTQFTINSISAISENEVKSNLTLKGDMYDGIYEVILKREKGNWLIDKITEKQTETSNEESSAMDDMATKNGAMEESVIDEKIGFLKEMYKNFFENNKFDTKNAANLKKYLSPDVMKRIYFECPYDECEGEKEYVVDVFYDGSLSYERPDVTITNRQINNIDNNWFEVVGADIYTNNQIKVQLEVRMGDNGYQVTDFKL